MKTRVVLFLLGLALVVPAVASAQGISFGVKGGVVWSSVPDLVGDDLGEFDTEYRTGFAGGAFLKLALLPGLAVQPEAIYMQKGVKSATPLGDVSFKFQYIDVPVLLRFTFGIAGVSAYIFGGPSFNFNLTAEAEYESRTEDITEDVESMETAAVGGIGIEFGKLLLEARISEGLKSIAKDPDEDLKTRSFVVMGGFRF